MRKRLAQFRKLGRTPEHKWAMLRNMVTSLIKYDRIETTLPKAKELRTLADQVVTYAKMPNAAYARQLAMRVLREKPACERLFEVLGPRYADRDGGYTRVMKLARPRKGDNAPMAVIEYVDRPGEIRAARVPARRRERYLFGNLGEVLENAGITTTPVADVDASSSRMQGQEQEQQTR